MADRATGGPGKPPLYKIVMLGDSGVGKTSLGEFFKTCVGVGYWYVIFLIHIPTEIPWRQYCHCVACFLSILKIRSRTAYKSRQASQS